ncbi:MAG: MFS transporter [Verrucomicrobiota bacterium]
MEEKEYKKGTFPLLWLVFFFHGMAPGFWLPSLTNVLKAQGLESWQAWAFAVPPICALISPLVGGALADERIAAQKIMAWSSLLGAVTIVLAFGALDIGMSPVWFLIGIAAYSLVSGPSWGLMATISLTHLTHGERHYPMVRVGATFGWMAAGFTISYLLHADLSLKCGYAAGVARVVAGLLSFYLPHTPPLGLGKSWKSALGLNGFKLFKNRDHAVLFSVTGLFSIPLMAFYMYSAELFKDLGNKAPTASVSVAQWSEVAALFLLGAMMLKFRLKTLLMWGLGLSVLRYAMSGYAGLSGIIAWHFAGVAMHGVCYTIYFVTAQVYLDRRVDPAMRGQAQGLMGLMASGIGPLVGAFFCTWLRNTCVDANGNGWEYFWWVLGGIIAVCWAAFGLLYKGMKAGQ